MVVVVVAVMDIVIAEVVFVAASCRWAGGQVGRQAGEPGRARLSPTALSQLQRSLSERPKQCSGGALAGTR